ncbi:arylesterase [Francisella adeliensis]|uniref:Arylesterase n=1 Tax=Francisella adeliensis TaxID=2007306 RepID=A0A2Z4XYP1_9GAMM|nr:arylesterase [Francisella adeliensis]AXA33909.1 arylesterase [Francisella adeliensis]MBK2085814.1 arylesterase [Francisella adeliensis]MBK2097692.1 arylesterase [Francisella adeliensis]QIW12146.1 arylesterase [Francisella adeliensis]QIW14020.1 arylesterase [Francisella adeliensis]
MKKLLILAIIAVFSYFAHSYFTGSNNNWKIINAKPSGKTIVAFGDSLTAGYGVSKTDNYPAQLSKLIGKPIINMGISGETTSEALARVDSVVAKDPKLVLITLGGNDLKKKIPAQEVFANLKKIVEILHKQGALVVILGIDIPYFSSDYADDYIQFAKDNGCLLVPNILYGLFGHSNLMVDSVHPNAKGYKIIANEIYPIIEGYL